MVKIRDFLNKHQNIEIELLLAHVLKKPKEFLYMEGSHQLSANQLISLKRLVKRREKGEPVAYILGYKDFVGRRFLVNKDVLIPRPESEWLVGRTAEHLLLFKEESPAKQGEVVGVPFEDSNPSVSLRLPPSLEKGRMLRVLDVGTGTGCIAISLAKEFSKSKVWVKITASDISAKALKVARQNAKQHKAAVQFVLSDLFKDVKGKFNVIVANLPYVPKKIYDLGFEGLKFEPVSALIDGTHSFQIYRRFFEQVGGHLNFKSVILLEIDPSSRKFLMEYQKKYLPSGKMRFFRDFNNFWRYAEIKI